MYIMWAFHRGEIMDRNTFDSLVLMNPLAEK